MHFQRQSLWTFAWPLFGAVVLSLILAVLISWPLRIRAAGKSSPYQFRLLDVGILCAQCAVISLPLASLRHNSRNYEVTLAALFVSAGLVLIVGAWLYATRLLSRARIHRTLQRGLILFFLPWISLLSTYLLGVCIIGIPVVFYSGASHEPTEVMIVTLISFVALAAVAAFWFFVRWVARESDAPSAESDGGNGQQGK